MDVSSGLAHRFRWSASVAALSLGFFVLASSSPVLANDPTVWPSMNNNFTPSPLRIAPNYVLARLAEKNSALDAYQASVKIEFKLHSFPFLREHLDGMAYFKRPSRYDMVFKRVPAYAKGFSHLSADLADPSSWDRRFYVTVVGERDLAGRRDLIMRLVQRVRGQIDHQDVAINPQLWEVDAMEYHYYNGGTISMQQHFENIGGFRLITSQDAQIQIPYIKAAAHADYTDYHTNVALSPVPMASPDGR